MTVCSSEVTFTAYTPLVNRLISIHSVNLTLCFRNRLLSINFFKEICPVILLIHSFETADGAFTMRQGQRNQKTDLDRAQAGNPVLAIPYLM